MGIKKSILILFAMISIIMIFHVHALARNNTPRENNIKAAYIYNFAKLVEWPKTTFASPDSPIQLGILGEDPLIDTLMTINNKVASGRAISIKKYRTVKEIDQCHILYIGKSEKNNQDTVLKKLQNKPCLTVSNIDGFARRGGMINFILVKNRVRFEINLQTTRDSDLKVSSRLLKIATIVGETPERGKN